MSPPTIYQHPLAYLLGLDGVALMRAFAGEYDQAFTEERFQEICDLLAREQDFGAGVDVSPMLVVDGYDGWAVTYEGMFLPPAPTPAARAPAPVIPPTSGRRITVEADMRRT